MCVVTIIECPEDSACVLADGIQGPIEGRHQHHGATVDVKVLLVNGQGGGVYCTEVATQHKPCSSASIQCLLTVNMTVQ